MCALGLLLTGSPGSTRGGWIGTPGYAEGGLGHESFRPSPVVRGSRFDCAAKFWSKADFTKAGAVAAAEGKLHCAERDSGRGGKRDDVLLTSEAGKEWDVLLTF